MQKLICKTLGGEGNYQSVSNTEKKAGIPFDSVYQDHIQLLHEGGQFTLVSQFLRKWSSADRRL